jgi:gamma-glutamylcyclotransferase (GGCT)/AIG2-like uncharacterized protein YtfP
MNDDLLFVYGTLRRDMRNEMYHLLARYAEFVAEGTYQGRLYQIDDYPGAVPSENPEEQVHGEVYALREPEIVLAKLELYEECGPGFSNPTEYVRRQERITLQNGTACYAWVYVYNRPTTKLVQISSGNYVEFEADLDTTSNRGKSYR